MQKLTPQRGDMMRRFVILAIVVVVVLTGAVAVLASSLFDDPAGKVDNWNTQDHSGPSYQPSMSNVSYVVERRHKRCRRKCQVKRTKVENRSGDKHRATTAELAAMDARSTAPIWCRTARGYIEGGNFTNPDLIHATISQQFCWRSNDKHNIVSLGTLNLSPAVSGAGSVWQWEVGDAAYSVNGSGRTCASGSCWDYVYRRGVFNWKQGWGSFSISINACVSITMRGTGDVVVGKPGC